MVQLIVCSYQVILLRKFTVATVHIRTAFIIVRKAILPVVVWVCVHVLDIRLPELPRSLNESTVQLFLMQIKLPNIFIT